MPLKQIVKSIDIEVAKRKRACRYSKNPILKDEKCMVVYEGPRSRFCYSKDVALKMIENARLRLDELQLQLK